LCVTEASKHIGVKETTGKNDGKEVQQYLKSVGLGKGYAWCAAFVRYVFDNCDNKIKTRSAMARAYINKSSIPAKDVLNGYVKIDCSYLAIWRNGNTASGHIEFVKSWKKRTGVCVEGNTNIVGSREGDGVYEKARAINPYSYFRITHFTKYN